MAPSRDRFARDATIAALIDRRVAREGARTASADGTGNGDTAADQLHRTLSDAVAAFELAQIRGRTSAALRAKRARGERAGNVPWGYRADADGLLHEDPSKQETLRRAKELRASGHSLADISDMLADEGRLNRRGRAFDLATLHRWLTPRA